METKPMNIIAKEQEHLAKVQEFGFWIYLMSDLIIFAVLFAVYAVLRGDTAGGPSADMLFELQPALVETFALLTSSFLCGMAMLSARAGKARAVTWWLMGTFACGMWFLGLEMQEFGRLIAAGAGWQRSAFLSSFFTLVGTHGLHIAVGLLWIVIMIVRVRMRGLTPRTVTKLQRFALFWHFLDLVWIFIFTVVYLMGIM
jgi:cytochrome o ubiquinol oxidase subunit 3